MPIPALIRRRVRRRASRRLVATGTRRYAAQTAGRYLDGATPGAGPTDPILQELR
jgi:hypothetical protein